MFTFFLCLLTFLYLLVVHLRRWNRFDFIHAEYHMKFARGELTPEDAQRILQVSAFYDMPTLLNMSLAFGLFRINAIPSISKILWASKDIKDEQLVSKRYTDTELLIATWLAFPISGFYCPHVGKTKPDNIPLDPRAMIALSRVNWIHSRSHIKNDDMIYAIGLLIREPIRWARDFGWRALSSMECQAYFIYWAEIGRRMGISDIPMSFEEMMEWVSGYEQAYLRPNRLGSKRVNGFFYWVPKTFGLRNLVEAAVWSLLDERLRYAANVPPPPRILTLVMKLLLNLVAFVQRHLCLPRNRSYSPVDMEVTWDASTPSRFHATKWQSRPWYKPESTGLSWLWDRVLVFVGVYSEMPNPSLRSGGYRIEELGSINLEKLGRAEVMRMAAGHLNCPVSSLFT